MTKVVALIVVMVLGAALGGCKSGEDVPEPSYTPIPDAELYDRIAAIEGVRSAEISYDKSFTNGSSYSGTLQLDPDVDGPMTLSRAYAILRQGRYRAAISVDAVQGDQQITYRSFGLFSPVDADLTEFFGPQPGNGTPPDPRS